MIPFGDDGEERVKKHLRQRAAYGFTTIEKPWGVSELPLGPRDTALLEDASNLLANTMFEAKKDPSEALEDIKALAAKCANLVIVSIEGLDPAGFDEETAGFIDALSGLNEELLKLSGSAVRISGFKAEALKGDPCVPSRRRLSAKPAHLKHLICLLAHSSSAAVSAFTRLPCPKASWGEGARLAAGFLPLAGVPAGAALALWIAVCRLLGLSPTLFASAAVAAPIVVTGGIHLDGFCDTVDALSCWSGKERMLEILADPHIGAFAAIWCCVCLILSFGLLHELYLRDLAWLACFSYPMSRSLAGFCALALPQAKPSGMLSSFVGAARKRECFPILAVFFLAAASCAAVLNPVAAAFGVLACAISLLQFRRMALRRFGGATGDLLGFLIQASELAMAAGFLAGGVLWSFF
jgi:adenosylcobinamide-GDP ribazoletransferase